jgi:protein LSM14
MSLKNVKGFGTEGRRNGENEIPPSENILGQVKFRVDLVKTFEIIEKPSEEKEDDPVDPAIISQEQEETKETPAKKRDDWAIGTKVKPE